MIDLAAVLFRAEMRIRARFGLDCTGCLQREINRVARSVK